MDDISASRSPKRKRADLVHEPRSLPHDPQLLHKTIFSFEVPSSSPVDINSDDGSSSPRTKVALTLSHLDLEDGRQGTTPTSGSGVIPALQLADGTSNANYTIVRATDQGHETLSASSPQPTSGAGDRPEHATTSAVFMFDGPEPTDSNHDMLADDDLSIARKRLKLPDPGSGTDLSPGPRGEASAIAAEPIKDVVSENIVLEATIDDKVIKSPSSIGHGSLKKSYPSINRLSDSKSRSRKKLPTSPLSKYKQPGLSSATKSFRDDEPVVVDPVRAALTWQEDEITIYDPEDKDDDGTGINGIGFKPSAAVAHQRAQKRRQQLAEYKKREESEARARRNQRRREHLGAPPVERKHSVVRVHFSDAEPSTVIMT
ncbi:uncharacterized protein B0I36DRAFT_128644 [Microdochium trichocladiopsis]|uniref:Uncharacterized protein n=1 Tax=Microdochium trichocladiopsis TaxID=1682393 RepID=A0A9P8Y2A2_9PEZI|nr:uncharacterized protein B0I36DRAFT_128644 [Microdochium trichocladiopsis]KAH7029129.1 hypothetical protein B0I36DRAFT_128644 [Microdochium trichocladiopsis]